MEVGLCIALALVAAQTVPADGPQTEPLGPNPPASGFTLGPLRAESPDGALKAVVVGSRADAVVARTTHALIARRGELVQWVRLPFAELPEAVLALDNHALHCVFPGDGVLGGQGASGRVTTLDERGRFVHSTALADVLPVGGVRAEGTPVGIAYGGSGACLSVSLVCGAVALVDFIPRFDQPYGLCELVRPIKHQLGIDAWLEQGHELAREGDLGAARYAFEAAIETDPSDARAYRELSRFHARAGDTELQLACLRLGVDRLYARATGAVTGAWSVGSPSARLVVDFVETTRKVSGDEACHQLLDEALALFPCMEQVVLMRAELLLEEDEDEAAIFTLDHALGLLDPNGDLAAAHHDVGRFLRRHRRGALAKRYLEDAYALGERSEFLLRGLSEISEQEGDFARATLWLTELAKLWSQTNGQSEPERSARGAKRLADLRLEIAELHERGVAAALPKD